MAVSVITLAGGESVNLVSIVAQSYTDLVIGATDTQLSSAANPFTSANVGATLTITGGTGFTPAAYVILSVSGAVATVDQAAGTAGSTGGVGTIGGPALRSVQFEMMDAVATSTSVFTGQVQAQQWMGADMWRGTCSYPPLAQADADIVIAMLAECRGMANAIQVGDPMKRTPRGTGGTGTVTAAAASGSQSISTSFGAGAILVGDYLQIGYRLYRALEATDGSDPIGIWPSVREALTGVETITTLNTVGLFRLGSNKRGWSADYTKLSAISFQIQEYR